MWTVPVLLFLIFQIWNSHSRLMHSQQTLDRKLDLLIEKMGLESELFYEISAETKKKLGMNNRIGAIRQISIDNETDYKRSAQILEILSKEGRVPKASIRD